MVVVRFARGHAELAANIVRDVRSLLASPKDDLN